MKSKTSQVIKWTIPELAELLEDEDSRVYFEKTEKHLALHPFYLTNLQTALNEMLSSTLNTYDADLKGFILAYKNLKLLTSLGEIFCDTCFIHVDIEADFYLFRPKIGCSLKGIVNKKGLDHIVVLIHKTFTVSIPKPDDTEEWPGDLVEIGQEVRCYVTYIDKNIKLPFICATLNSDYLLGYRLSQRINNINEIDTEMENKYLNNIKKTVVNSIVTESEDNTVSDKDKKKKKKQKKKSHDTDSEFVLKNKIKVEYCSESENDNFTVVKCEDTQQCKSMEYMSNTNDTETNNIPKKRKKNKIKTKSSDLELDNHVKIKVEKCDSTVNKLNDTNSNSQLLFDIDAHNMTSNKHGESSRNMKRKHSVTDIILEPEEKKRKKHLKKSKESDVESTSDLSSNNLNVNSTSKKHKKSSVIMSDSELQNYNIKTEVTKYSVTHATIDERLENQMSYNNEEIQILSENTDKYKCIKKEKKNKHKKTFEDSDLESVVKIKKEDETIDANAISKVIKVEEESEIECTKYNTSNISLSNCVLKKKKKKKKAYKMSDSDSEYHPVKINVEKD